MKKQNHSQKAIQSIYQYSSRKEWEKARWDELLRAPDVIAELLTLHEQKDIVLRAAVRERLYLGFTYKEISEELWLSPQTISVIKKGMHGKNHSSYWERSKTERKKKVYGSSLYSKSKKKILIGKPKRTKYGTIYL